MRHGRRIFVAGHRGLLGRALLRVLGERGHTDVICATQAELDLASAREVDTFFARERPDRVLLAAARVGGIVANRREPADMLRENLAIELCMLDAAHRHGVERLVMFGSSCMYPRIDDRAIAPSDLWAGPLEPTSRAYATAKLAGVELCRAYREQHGARFSVLVPATLYGPHDHFGTARAHVIPALIERVLAARAASAPEVTVLGTGRALREFLHCDDAARAALSLLECDSAPDLVHAGSGEEVTVAALAARIAKLCGYHGALRFDSSAPDGAARKLLDSSTMRALGWRPRISLADGLRETAAWYERERAARRDDVETMEAGACGSS
jgi:GDP-L-fucose synthase